MAPTIPLDDSPPALLATGLTKSFGSVRAVDGIDVRIAPAERVAVIGPNGAGKTTTLLMMLGAIDPDAGHVEVFGRRLDRARNEAMADVGFAAGYLPLPGALSVTECLRFFAQLAGVTDVRRAVEDTLAALSIGHLGRQRCDALSSGQRTLVGIAKATVHRPRLLVLDEPTASLDPDVALRVRDRLAALNAEHSVTLLMTSHDMREVAELTERVLFLRAGKVVADGAPDDITAEHGHDSLDAMFLAEAQRHRTEEIT